jgi:HemY protein
MRIVETAWRKTPHPDLAEIYLRARAGDTARDRLKRAEALASRAQGDPEGALTIARAAIDARDFARARKALEPMLAGAPTVRACLLMEEIEELELGDAGRAREWLSRALRAPPDPTWVADGIVSDVWMPLSPVSGRLDAFVWKTPAEAVHPALAPSVAIAATERLIAHAIPAEPAASIEPPPELEPVVVESVPQPAPVAPIVIEAEPIPAPDPEPVAEAVIEEAEVVAPPAKEKPPRLFPPLPDDPGPGEEDLAPEARRVTGAAPR